MGRFFSQNPLKTRKPRLNLNQNDYIYSVEKLEMKTDKAQKESTIE